MAKWCMFPNKTSEIRNTEKLNDHRRQFGGWKSLHNISASREHLRRQTRHHRSTIKRPVLAINVVTGIYLSCCHYSRYEMFQMLHFSLMRKQAQCPKYSADPKLIAIIIHLFVQSLMPPFRRHSVDVSSVVFLSCVHSLVLWYTSVSLHFSKQTFMSIQVLEDFQIYMGGYD